MKRITYFIYRMVLNILILLIYFAIGMITMLSTLLQFGFKIILALLLIPIGLMIYHQEWLNILYAILIGGLIQMILMVIQVIPTVIEPYTDAIVAHKSKYYLPKGKENKD